MRKFVRGTRRSAAAAPTDADWQYLGIRCNADGPQRDAQFIAAHEKWPDNGWLALAAAATSAAARQLPGGRPALRKGIQGRARDARVPGDRRRARAPDQSRHRRQPARSARSIRSNCEIFAAIESGEDVAGTPLEAYDAIAHGQLQRAVALAKKAENGSEDHPVAGGCLGRREPEMIETALELTVPENADLATMFAMYGLAAREGRDTTPYAKRIEATLGRRGGAGAGIPRAGASWRRCAAGTRSAPDNGSAHAAVRAERRGADARDERPTRLARTG